LILKSNPTKPSGFNHSVVILPNCGKKVSQKMLVVRVTENVQAVQSSYYSSCPWAVRWWQFRYSINYSMIQQKNIDFDIDSSIVEKKGLISRNNVVRP
jgi:hypothetical protein